MQVVREQYSSYAQKKLSFVFDFEKDFVSLDIPKEGLKLNGWKITPLYNPKVSSSLYESDIGMSSCLNYSLSGADLEAAYQ